MQIIGTSVVDVVPDDYFDLIARHTSGSIKSLAADELRWFPVAVTEWPRAIMLRVRRGPVATPGEDQRV